MGIRSRISRNTLANANEVRDWRIYADFAQRLIAWRASSTSTSRLAWIWRRLSMRWIPRRSICACRCFRGRRFDDKAAVKLHTLLDLRGNIPVFIHISDGKLHDVNILDQLVPEPGAFYVMDRGYLDFERLSRLARRGQLFCHTRQNRI